MALIAETTAGNGDWSAAGTWTLGVVPLNGANVYTLILNHNVVYDDGVTNTTTIFLKAVDSFHFAQSGTGLFYNPPYSQGTAGNWRQYDHYTVPRLYNAAKDRVESTES